MIDWPTAQTFSAITSEPRFLAAIVIATVAGLVRGFSGFGSALIYMPLISAIYDPKVAASTLLLIDTICSLPFSIKVMPKCNWREVTPAAIAGAVTLPLGVMALLFVDPLALRWLIAALVLTAVITLAAGWRYRGRPTVAASLGVGALAGFGGGAVQIGAPPLLVFWLGGTNSAATVRANIMVYFMMQGGLSFVFYAFSGLFTVQIAALSLLFGIPFALALALGVYGFHGSSELRYRRVAYLIIAFAGLASLPVFDALR
jgi:uncharacterized protein